MEGEAQEGSRRNDADSEGLRWGKGCISVTNLVYRHQVMQRKHKKGEMVK